MYTYLSNSENCAKNLKALCGISRRIAGKYLGILAAPKNGKKKVKSRDRRMTTEFGIHLLWVSPRFPCSFNGVHGNSGELRGEFREDRRELRGISGEPQQRRIITKKRVDFPVGELQKKEV